MSSRRSSAIATAEASLQGSRSGSPNDNIQIDTSMTDLTNIEEEEDENKMGSTSSYIQRSPQLDIAFLHSISTHRPLGPHKHFNVIPVLITLDRTIRQIGARRRDASTSEPLEDVEEDKSGTEEEESSSKRKRNDRSPSTSKKVIKKEDLDEDILLDPAHAATTSAIPVDAEMVWQRLSELYDLEGLEELEDGAVDGEDDSPFFTSPPPTYFSIATRKVLGEKIKSKPVFGFGSSLIKLPESAISTPTKSSGRQQKQSKARAAQNEQSDDEEEEEQIADFELGPWEEFEDLIAPRRLKSYAPDEGQSESDEELSEPSAETKVAVGKQGEEDEDDIEAEEDENEESEDDEEDGDEDEDEEDEEDEDEDEEEEEKKPSKRKGASSSKRPPANSRRKSGTASATPTATASASTRTSRSSAKPRRSARR